MTVPYRPSNGTEGHPDAAWSPCEYFGPEGIETDPCRHAPRRMRVGPTGRRRFSIISDSCGLCGRILRTYADLTWPEYAWVRRWNTRLGAAP